MDKLIIGIRKFKEKDFQERKNLFKSLANNQAPEVLFITCSDSRIDPSLITQTEPGELFICRNVGNIVPPHVITAGGITASIEYAVEILNVKDVVVCGHTDCGAIKGAMYPDSISSLHHVSNWLGHSAAAQAKVKARHGELCEENTLEVIQENVVLQLKHLETHPSVATALAKGKMQLHGWVYDIAEGEITFYDEKTTTFTSIESYIEKIESI
jgi:carbonic anhydrase